MSSRVLVLDADQRSALAATRSLGATGLSVITADSSSQSLASTSKFSQKHLKFPDPTEHPSQFLEAIDTAIRTQAIDVVMPMTDVTTMLLVDQRERLAPAKMTCASAESYNFVSDKWLLAQRAISLGVPVPRSSLVTSVAELRAAQGTSHFPFVLKPTRSRYLHDGKIYSTAVRVVANTNEFEATVSSATWLDHIPGIVQEFIPGHGSGAFALGDGEDIIAWFAHRRIREKPPSGGVSVLCESVAVDERIREHSARLLRSVNWFGPAMVEYRVSADGTPYLMEVNGRFWGSLQLSIDSGINFPCLLHSLMTQATTRSSDHTYRTGTRLRWLLGDLDNLLIRLRSLRSAREKLAAGKEFMGTFFDGAARQEIFRWSDPSPAWFEVKKWLRALK